ncbi:MAG: hypothetical protein KAG53_04800 [Endozoicomonadaceae bacterium]|nr:hypothetical protein [Endozoicomonadaceae bacterium]
MQRINQTAQQYKCYYCPWTNQEVNDVYRINPLCDPWRLSEFRFLTTPPTLTASVEVEDREVALVREQANIGICISVSGVSRSLGDEISSYNIMHSLTNMGFKGSFSVVYCCPCCNLYKCKSFDSHESIVQEKFKKLFFNYDFKNNCGLLRNSCGEFFDIRFFHFGELLKNKRALKEFACMDVKLLFSGIYTTIFEWLIHVGASDCLVGITPYQWDINKRYTLLRKPGLKSGFLMCGNGIISPHNCIKSLHSYVNDNALLHDEELSIFEVADSIYKGNFETAAKQQISQFPYLNEKKIIFDVLQSAKDKRIVLCSVYGLEQKYIIEDKINIVDRISFSIASAVMHQGDKDVYIALINNFNNDELNRLDNKLAISCGTNIDMRVLQLKHFSLTHKNRLGQKKKRVHILPVGFVSNQLFKGMIQYSTMAFVEGANSVSQCIRYKTPYMSVVNSVNSTVAAPVNSTTVLELISSEMQGYELTPLPQSYDYTGSWRETMIMTLASQCIRGKVAIFNLNHWIDSGYLVARLIKNIRREFLCVCSSLSLQKYDFVTAGHIINVFRNLMGISQHDDETVSFLYHNFMVGNLSLRQAFRLINCGCLSEDESRIILTKIIKNEYLNNNSKLKHFFDEYSTECSKNDVMKGALTDLLELLDSESESDYNLD